MLLLASSGDGLQLPLDEFLPQVKECKYLGRAGNAVAALIHQGEERKLSVKVCRSIYVPKNEIVDTSSRNDLPHLGGWPLH